ncbi:MAG: hypothetical protein BRD48_05700, partial [Bacteroidetes bacterium QS_9_68_14]
MRHSTRSLLLLFAGALALVLAGCDSSDSDDGGDVNAAVVQFASGGVGAVPADSTVTATVTLDNPQGAAVSVEVLFANQASTATRAEIGGYETQRLEFDADAEAGAEQTLTFDVSNADITDGAITATLALQQVESSAPARIGEQREFDINLGPTPLAEARDRGTGATVTVEGTVTRAFGSFVRLQDESRAGLVIRQTEGDFNEAVAGGTVQPGTQLRLTGTLSAFNGLLQINEDDLASYTVIGMGDRVEPREATLAEIAADGEAFESELVRIEGLTFPDASGSFASSTSYTVEGPDGTTLTFRVQGSDQSELSGVAIPDSAFTFTGPVGEFNDDYQLIPIRASDIGASDDDGDDDGDVIAIAEARDMGTDASVTVEGVFTRIEDINARIQDSSGETGASGLVVRSEALATAITDGDVERGDRLRVSGTTGAFNGLFQISADVSFEVVEDDAGRPEAQSVGLSDVTGASGENYESELVTIDGLAFETDADAFAEESENYTVTGDDDTEATVRIVGDSFYADAPVPAAPVTFTGVVGQFNGGSGNDEGYQLFPLIEGDLVSSDDGGGGDAQVILAEDFQDGADLGAFSQYSVSSDSNWVHRSFEENGYAYINQFDADEAANDWLITDEVLALDDFENEVLTFANVKRYGSEDTDLRLKYSTDYDGEGD